MSKMSCFTVNKFMSAVSGHGTGASKPSPSPKRKAKQQQLEQQQQQQQLEHEQQQQYHHQYRQHHVRVSDGYDSSSGYGRSPSVSRRGVKHEVGVH